MNIISRFNLRNINSDLTDLILDMNSFMRLYMHVLPFLLVQNSINSVEPGITVRICSLQTCCKWPFTVDTVSDVLCNTQYTMHDQ